MTHSNPTCNLRIPLSDLYPHRQNNVVDFAVSAAYCRAFSQPIARDAEPPICLPAVPSMTRRFVPQPPPEILSPPVQAPAITFPDPIPGIIPFGTITLFAGAPGVGKTAMLADWIVRWRDGRTIWGHSTQAPTQFCYIAADRQWASHQQWFNAVGYPDIPRYSLADDPRFDLSELLKPYNALDLFRRTLDKANNGQPPIPGAHVFIDPVSPVFIAGNPNAARDVARTLIGMSREAQARQINLTLTAHFGKQVADKTARYQRPQDRIAGSGAFSGFSDTQIYMVDPEPPDHPFHCLGWNPRHSRPEEFTCTRGDNGLFVPYDVMYEDEVATQVLDCLDATGATSIATIAERVFDQLGYSRSSVKRAIERLLEQGRIARVGQGRSTQYHRVKLH